MKGLTNRQISALTSLEEEAENYLVHVWNIPRITESRAAKLIDEKLADVKERAKQVTGFKMKAQVRVRTSDYIIVDLYPADEPAPVPVVLRPEYDYTKRMIG